MPDIRNLPPLNGGDTVEFMYGGAYENKTVCCTEAIPLTVMWTAYNFPVPGGEVAVIHVSLRQTILFHVTPFVFIEMTELLLPKHFP